MLLHGAATELAVIASAILGHTKVQALLVLHAEFVTGLDVAVGLDSFAIIIAHMALTTRDVPQHKLVLATVLLANRRLRCNTRA